MYSERRMYRPLRSLLLVCFFTLFACGRGQIIRDGSFQQVGSFCENNHTELLGCVGFVPGNACTMCSSLSPLTTWVLSNGSLDIEFRNVVLTAPGSLDLNSLASLPPALLSQLITVPFAGPWNVSFWSARRFGPCSDTVQIPKYISVIMNVSPGVLVDHLIPVPQCADWFVILWNSNFFSTTTSSDISLSCH